MPRTRTVLVTLENVVVMSARSIAASLTTIVSVSDDVDSFVMSFISTVMSCDVVDVMV